MGLADNFEIHRRALFILFPSSLRDEVATPGPCPR
jgi:hypothetical protein